LHPPGGIVGGDKLIIKAKLSDKTSALVTTPGATKYYGTNGQAGSQHQQIDICNGSLEWFPQESIFFSNCHAEQQLRINLDKNSRFIGWDINCFGRPSGNHSFESGLVTTRLEIYIDDKPQLLERLKVHGSDDMNKITGLRKSTVNATMIAIAPTLNSSEWLSIVRAQITDAAFAATLIDGLLLIRYLGHSAEQAKTGFIKIWQTLRPVIMQKPCELPRIWAT